MLRADPFNAFLPPPAGFEPPAPGSGPLAGARLAVKDIFDVKGWPTGCGNPEKQAEAAPAPAHAPAVARLLDAGATFVGKTQTDELAFSLFGANAHFPRPVNPAAPKRITGGSSSGSAAAVAAGLADLALGSDTGGSVRAPASFCGILGLRPTHGAVPLDGVMPLAPSLDTAGLFARDLGLLAAGWTALCGQSAAADPEPFRRLFHAPTLDRLVFSGSEAAHRQALAAVADGLGRPEPVDAPGLGSEALYWCFRRIQGFEAWRAHGAWIEGGDRRLGPGVAERFAQGRTVTEAEAAAERTRRAAFAADLRALLGEGGVLVLPTMPGPAPFADAGREALDALRERALTLLCAAGLSGLPQLTLPLAQAEGAPFGLSLLGPAGSEARLLALAAALPG